MYHQLFDPFQKPYWPETRDQVIANAREALPLNQAIGDEELIIDSKMILGKYLPCAETEALIEGVVHQLEARHDLVRLNYFHFCLVFWTGKWGEFETAIGHCDAAIRVAAELGVLPVQYPTIKAGRPDDLRRIDERLVAVGTTLPKEAQIEIDLYMGHLHEALESTEQIVEMAWKANSRVFHVSALELKLRILLQLGRPDDVIASATVVLQMADEMRFLPMIWRLQASQAHAFDMLGDTESARKAYGKANVVIQRLAQEISDTELREDFLSNPLISSITKLVSGDEKK